MCDDTLRLHVYSSDLKKKKAAHAAFYFISLRAALPLVAGRTPALG